MTKGTAMSDDERIGKSLAYMWLGRNDPVMVWTAIAAKARALLSPPAREMVALTRDEMLRVYADYMAKYDGDEHVRPIVLIEMAAKAQRNKTEPKAGPAEPQPTPPPRGVLDARAFLCRHGLDECEECAAQPTPAKAESATPAIDALERLTVEVDHNVRAAVAKDTQTLRERAERAEAATSNLRHFLNTEMRDKLEVLEYAPTAAIRLLRTLRAELDAAKAELAEIRALSIQSTMPAHRELMPALAVIAIPLLP